MYYIIIAKDVANSLEKRRSVREAYLARLHELEQSNRLLTAGPYFLHDDDNPITGVIIGSTIIAQFNSLSEATEWAAADPYVTAGVYANVDIHPYKKVL